MNKKHFRHCFDKREWQLIESDPTMHQFFLFWTQKEAILKAVGVGLTALNDITTVNPNRAFINYKNDLKEMHMLSLDLGINNLYTCFCSIDLQALTDIKINACSLEDLIE